MKHIGKRTVAIVVLLVMFGAPGTAYLVTRVQAEQGKPRAVSLTVPQLGAPSVQARMTRAAVLAKMEHEFGSVIATHPITFQYGSFTDQNLQLAGIPVRNRDVWEITVSGLDIQRPCDVTDSQLAGGQPSCPPNAQTLVAVFDDATGNLIEGMAG
jgi:hypothetical protein